MEERKEKEEGKLPENKSIVIPVVQEQVNITKNVIETGKVFIRKRITEEEGTLNIPVVQEGYQIERVAVNKIVDTPPGVRQEGDTTIIPVVREVLVVEKRYEIMEEVHVIKQKTSVPHVQEITLKKENVEVERKPIQGNNQP